MAGRWCIQIIKSDPMEYKMSFWYTAINNGDVATQYGGLDLSRESDYMLGVF